MQIIIIEICMLKLKHYTYRQSHARTHTRNDVKQCWHFELQSCENYELKCTESMQKHGRRQ